MSEMPHYRNYCTQVFTLAQDSVDNNKHRIEQIQLNELQSGDMILYEVLILIFVKSNDCVYEFDIVSTHNRLATGKRWIAKERLIYCCYRIDYVRPQTTVLNLVALQHADNETAASA